MAKQHPGLDHVPVFEGIRLRQRQTLKNDFLYPVVVLPAKFSASMPFKEMLIGVFGGVEARLGVVALGCGGEEVVVAAVGIGR